MYFICEKIFKKMLKAPDLPSRVQRANSPHLEDSSFEPDFKTEEKKKIWNIFKEEKFMWQKKKTYKTEPFLFNFSHNEIG